jgi:hypothetical protein
MLRCYLLFRRKIQILFSKLGKPPMGTLVAAHANPLQVAVETADQPPLNIAAKPGVSVNTMALSSVPHSIDAETLGISTGIVCLEAPTIARMVAYGKFLDDRTGFCHMEALG